MSVLVHLLAEAEATGEDAILELIKPQSYTEAAVGLKFHTHNLNSLLSVDEPLNIHVEYNVLFPSVTPQLTASYR